MTAPFDGADYRRATDHFPNFEARPLIGITGNFGDKGCELAEGYYESIVAAGGVPVVLPPTMTQPEQAISLLERLDGILLSGGADLNPLYVGEEPVPGLGGINARRDRFEMFLIRLARDRQIPMLGICRGIQMLAAALGGKIIQDLSSANIAPLIKHSQQAERGVPTHTVQAKEGSLVRRLLGDEFAVNSFHHQAVADAGPSLTATAWAKDGVIEAVENETGSIVGVQWHPECFLAARDESMMPLFRHLTAQAEAFRKAKAFHQSNLTLDSHCDTPMFFDKGVRLDRRDPQLLVDFHKMAEGRLNASIMVAYIPQGPLTDEGRADATRMAARLLGELEERVGRTGGVALARTPDELAANKRRGIKSIMRGIENGYAIGRDLSLIEHFRKMGIVYMTLCHNGDNDLCDSARRSQQTHGGLSDFGREAVREMNRTGMMVDLSHAAETSFYDALRESRVPIVCSHSSCRALCNHPRNLTDDQLRALAEKGGVAQITFYNGFLVEGDAVAGIHDAVRHILHAVSVAGIDHVGIGTDFDGDGGVRGLDSASSLIKLTEALQAEGIDHEDLEKIWGGNFLRVMRQAQAAAKV